jgi:hypothetical protein
VLRNDKEFSDALKALETKYNTVAAGASGEGDAAVGSASAAAAKKAAVTIRVQSVDYNKLNFEEQIKIDLETE